MKANQVSQQQKQASTMSTMTEACTNTTVSLKDYTAKFNNKTSYNNNDFTSVTNIDNFTNITNMTTFKTPYDLHKKMKQPMNRINDDTIDFNTSNATLAKPFINMTTNTTSLPTPRVTI